jgi:peptide/nickel transport system permease protein
MTALAQPRAAEQSRGPFAGALEFLRLLAQRPAGLLGFIGVAFFLCMGLVAPFFVPVHDALDLTAVYEPPSLAHLLGTDFQGRDVLNQLVHGGREVLIIALLAAFLSTFIAVTFGSIAATVGGKADAAILMLTDVALTVPPLILLIVVAAVLRPTSVWFLAAILAATQWSYLLRPIRAQILSLTERDYVEAARSLDLGLFHIIFREMLPNMRSYIVIHFILAMTTAVYAQAAVVLLGLVPLSGQNWGVMLYFATNQGALFFRDSLMYVLSPILAIAFLQLSLVSFAGALEEIFNPRLRGA